MSNNKKQEFFATLDAIKNIAADALKEENKTADIWSQISPFLLNLKSMNRNVFDELQYNKKFADEARYGLDEQQLKLENLQYRQQYLLREIEQQKDVSLPNIDSIESDIGETIALKSYASNILELHQQSIQKLESEKKRRIEFLSQLDGLKKENETIEDTIKRKKRFVETIPGIIEKSIQSTMDLQERFSKELASIQGSNQSDQAPALSATTSSVSLNTEITSQTVAN